MRKNIAYQIQLIHDNPQKIHDLSLATIECAKKWSWDSRCIYLNDVLDRVVNENSYR